MTWKPQPEELVSFESGADKRYLAHVEVLRRAPRADKEAPLTASCQLCPVAAPSRSRQIRRISRSSLCASTTADRATRSGSANPR